MINSVNSFRDPDFCDVRIIFKNGEILFAWKDVAKALGYKDTNYALNAYVDIKDKQFVKKSEIVHMNFLIPNRGLTAINESGLYSLIRSSKLPTAKKFEDWITKEVLPIVYKDCGFPTDDEQPAIRTATEVDEEQGENIKPTDEEIIDKITEEEDLIYLEYWDKIRCIRFSEACKYLRKPELCKGLLYAIQNNLCFCMATDECGDCFIGTVNNGGYAVETAKEVEDYIASLTNEEADEEQEEGFKLTDTADIYNVVCDAKNTVTEAEETIQYNATSDSRLLSMLVGEPINANIYDVMKEPGGIKISSKGRKMLFALRSLIKKALVAETDKKGIIIKNPQDVANVMAPRLRYENKEHFDVIVLNTQNQIIDIINISVGGLRVITVPIAGVFKEILKYETAWGVIFVQNNPSGDIDPSIDDISLTHRLIQCGNLLNICVFDHIIIGDGYKSLREEGIITRFYGMNK